MEINQTLIYFIMGLLVLSGSINTITNKIQNHSISLGVTFHHVWWLTAFMFLGESTCLIVYYVIKYKNKNLLEDHQPQEENQGIIERKIKQELSVFKLMVPPVLDLCGTTLMTFGLTMMAGSVYQMFRGSLIIFTALLSIFYLKNKHHLNHFLGWFLVVIGLLLVGISAYSAKEGASTSMYGIWLIILAQLFTSIQYIYEEYLTKTYKCHPIGVIGWEGVWGLCFSIILLTIFQFIDCRNSVNDICTVDNNNVFKVENTIFAFKQLGNNMILLSITIWYVFSIAFYNVAGITVSKYSTGTARAVVDSLRTVVVWCFFMFGFIPGNIRETFAVTQFVGFIVLVFGTCVYNEVIKLDGVFSDDVVNAKQGQERENKWNVNREGNENDIEVKENSKASTYGDDEEEGKRLIEGD